MKECTTHHYAYDCREKQFKEIIEQIEFVSDNLSLNEYPFGFISLLDLVENFKGKDAMK